MPPPTREDARDPDWRGYTWTYLDRIARDLDAAGMEALAVVRRAPAYFEAQPRYRFAADGTWAPDPVAYFDFAIAAARR